MRKVNSRGASWIAKGDEYRTLAPFQARVEVAARKNEQVQITLNGRSLPNFRYC
jgi:hypothetical protein